MPKANKVHIKPPAATLNEQLVAKQIGERRKALGLNAGCRKHPLTRKDLLSRNLNNPLRNPRHLPVGVEVHRVAVVKEGNQTQPLQGGERPFNPQELGGVIELCHM